MDKEFLDQFANAIKGDNKLNENTEKTIKQIKEKIVQIHNDEILYLQINEMLKEEIGKDFTKEDIINLLEYICLGLM